MKCTFVSVQSTKELIIYANNNREGCFYGFVTFLQKPNCISSSIAWVLKSSDASVILAGFDETHANASAQERLSYYLLSFFELMQSLGQARMKSFFMADPIVNKEDGFEYKDVLFFPEIKAIIADGITRRAFKQGLSTEANDHRRTPSAPRKTVSTKR